MNDAQWIVIIDYYCRICRAAISTHRNSTATTRDALGSNPGGSIRNMFVSFFSTETKRTIVPDIMDTPLDSRHRQIRRWRWVFGKARDMEQLVAICLSSSASVPRAPGCTAGVHHRRLCTRTYALVLGDSDKLRVWFHSNVTRRHNCPALKHDRDCPRHLALFLFRWNCFRAFSSMQLL